ncbi:MAG: M23 family metallopeptidase [Steroidobacteraceae bacterium]
MTSKVVNRWQRVIAVLGSRFVQLRAAVVTLLLVAAAAFWGGIAVVPEDPDIARWDAALTEQREMVDRTRADANQQIDALAARVGELNARLIRLDALGKRLTEAAELDAREFNFDAPPAVGGPENPMPGEVGAEAPSVEALLDSLQATIDDRSRQLAALETLILSRELAQQIVPGGTPVEAGYISSFYGSRTDPFTGKAAFHAGLDFAGPPGTRVLAAADGVVSKVGRSKNFGNFVEITHGKGYVSRYGHNASLLVQAGDTVKRGDPIAMMGSTGRSTGTHLHFEVIKNGRSVNPLVFVKR